MFALFEFAGVFLQFNVLIVFRADWTGCGHCKLHCTMSVTGQQSEQSNIGSPKVNTEQTEKQCRKQLRPAAPAKLFVSEFSIFALTQS